MLASCYVLKQYSFLQSVKTGLLFVCLYHNHTMCFQTVRLTYIYIYMQYALESREVLRYIKYIECKERVLRTLLICFNP